jgi:hypothetical protein
MASRKSGTRSQSVSGCSGEASPFVHPTRYNGLPPVPSAGELKRARGAKRRWRRDGGHAGGSGVFKMDKHRIFATKFASVYPFYVQKAERKGRTKDDVDRIICWLTGYSQAGLQRQLEQESDFQTFFAQAPAIHPNSAQIKGVVCGVRVEEIEDPLMQKIRWLDKLIDELAKGKAMDKILR